MQEKDHRLSDGLHLLRVANVAASLAGPGTSSGISQ